MKHARLAFLLIGSYLTGLAVLPANQSKEPSPKFDPKPCEVQRKAPNVRVVIDENSKVYLDGREVCWPLENKNVEVEKLIFDNTKGYNYVVEVRFRSLPPPGYEKMPKGPKEQEKGPK